MGRRWIVWVRNILVALVVAAFVIVFGQPGAGPATAPVAEIDGDPVSRDLFEFFRAQNETLLRNVGQDLEPGMLQDLLDSQTVGALVRRNVVTGAATDLGIWVAGDEVRSRVVTDPNFSTGGRFDSEIFEQFVVRAGLDTRIYTEEVRKDLVMQKFQRLVASPVRLSTAAADESARRARTSVRLRLAVARPEDFRADLEVEEDELSAFAEGSQDRIEQAYTDRRDEFVQPEEVHARHMLFTGEDASARAEKAFERIGAGEKFGALARELSDDLATKEDGGDLGFFPRGRMLPTFEETAFALQPGEVSEPIETPRGVHLILVEERHEGSERTVEEVRLELARDLWLDERARANAREAAERTAEALGEGRPFEEAAEADGLRLETTPPIEWAQVELPEIGRAPELRIVAFTLTEESPTANRVFEIRDGYALISLLERTDPSDEQVRTEAQQLRETRAQELRTRVMTRWFERKRTELEEGGRLVVYPLYPSG
jgi:peptidyl-prolyl cis-trans isomerase D